MSSISLDQLPARFHDVDDVDLPQEECGIFAVYGHSENAAISTFFALHALQHRGQEMAGIATFDGQNINVHKGVGLVSQIFTEEHTRKLPGKIAVGHTRYSTAGGKALSNAQPFVLETDLGQVAVCHNGQLTRQKYLRKLLLSRGTGLFTNSDSEILAQMLAHPASREHERQSSPSPRPVGAPVGQRNQASPRKGQNMSNLVLTRTPSFDDRNIKYDGLVSIHKREFSAASHHAHGERLDHWQRRLVDLMSDAEGAYALVLLCPGIVYGARDRLGIRPLCLGSKKNADGTVSHSLSSESCAFGPIGYKFDREVRPGEIVRLDATGVTSIMGLGEETQSTIPPALCVFEYVYFARPDTILEDKKLVHTVRQRFGRQLARESAIGCPHVVPDIVAGVPDSSIAAAIGYSMETGVPFMEVLCKNRYIGRTFIQPDQAMRENSIRLKFNPLSANLEGKSIILVDDSLVRGNTLRQLIPLLKNAGAREVHIRISSPVLRHPCYMGVDIGTYDEILAHHAPTVEEMRAFIGADSLLFLSLEGMLKAVKEDDPTASKEKQHCTACFTGDYPIQLDIEDEARSMNRGHC